MSCLGNYLLNESVLSLNPISYNYDPHYGSPSESKAPNGWRGRKTTSAKQYIINNVLLFSIVVGDSVFGAVSQRYIIYIMNVFWPWHVLFPFVAAAVSESIIISILSRPPATNPCPRESCLEEVFVWAVANEINFHFVARKQTNRSLPLMLNLSELNAEVEVVLCAFK